MGRSERRGPGRRAPSTVAGTGAMSSAPGRRAPSRALALRWPPILQGPAHLELPQYLGLLPVQFPGGYPKCRHIFRCLTAHC